jgi:NAD(P)-dependent dehydrogenase (short-subunit alcohol dehydrogenase family)
MDQLAGKVAVVTGAASGIGNALARRFAEAGMRVAMADIEEGALDEAAADLSAGHGADDVLAVVTDVSDGSSVEALRDAVLERFGSFHVVCNNAGVGGGGGPMWTLTEADWAWTLGVNLWGVIHGIRAFVPHLVEQGEGHVVNTASVAGLLSVPMMGPYAATKHAVVGLSETLALDLQLAGSAVGVSVLCPGWVNTRIIDSDRNRPEHLASDSPTLVAGDGARDFVRQLLASGMDPAEVARQVHDAVVDNRFYVITHAELLSAVKTRHAAVESAQGPPPIGLFA